MTASSGTREVVCARVKVVRGNEKGRTLELGEQSSIVIGSHAGADLVLTDPRVSRRHAELFAEGGGYVLRDLGSTNGVFVGTLRIREAVLTEKAKFSIGDTELEIGFKSDVVEHELSARDHYGPLIGRSPRMRELFAMLERVAPTDATVLLTGESGTGKEGAAEALHLGSSRASGPLITVDCGSLAKDLFEAELFGFEKGAFTGADRARRGLAEEADGGTLFLDEVGELPLDLQPRLLRLLESRELRRVGASHSTAVNIRVVAATHRPLATLVDAGRFRNDLYHRLAVVRIEVPPLRHHREDIPLLAEHFVGQLKPGFDARQLLTPEMIAAFSSHLWPGNIRELKNVIERLLAAGELASALRTSPSATTTAGYATARRDSIDRFERDYCQMLLEVSAFNVTRAAEAAGISRQLFHRLMQKHGINER